MSIITVGPYIMETASSGEPNMAKVSDIVKGCLHIIGNPRNQAMLDLGLDGYNRAINWVNLSGFYTFGTQVQSDATLVSGTATVSLPSNFYAMRAVQLIYATGDDSGEVYATLGYMPWDQRNALLGGPAKDTGIPRIWTAVDTFGNGTIELDPVPGDQEATDYKVRLTTLKRVEKAGTLEDTVTGPRELEEPICEYLEAFLLERREKDNPAQPWVAKYQRAERLLRKFKAREWAQAGGMAQMRPNVGYPARSAAGSRTTT